MAISKLLYSSSLVMEIQAGEDKNGNKVYKKKTFSGVKTDAPVENIYAVAQAITAIIEKPTRDFYLNESSMIVSE